MHEKKRVKTK